MFGLFKLNIYIFWNSEVNLKLGFGRICTLSLFSDCTTECVFEGAGGVPGGAEESGVPLGAGEGGPLPEEEKDGARLLGAGDDGGAEVGGCTGSTIGFRGGFG